MVNAANQRTRLALLAVVTALSVTLSLVASGAALAEDGRDAASGKTVVIEMRIWQHIDDLEDIWVSARPKGGRWDTLGTVPFPLDRNERYVAYEHGFHQFGVLWLEEIGAALRVWQRYSAPALIYVEACGSFCPSIFYWKETNSRIERLRNHLWAPLGVVPLPLDDGHGSDGLYRYGDLTVAVPIGNDGLLADREYLLALRDALAGEATLDWSASTPTSSWEGVSISGSPPRVTGLHLSERNLTGQLWGWLGNLPALTELRLDGNRLTGSIPSRLVTLSQLTSLRLGGNDIGGCVPPRLRVIEDNDLAALSLPDCPAPTWLFDKPLLDRTLSDRLLGEGTYIWESKARERLDRPFGPSVRDEPYAVNVLDVPPGMVLELVWLAPVAETDDTDPCIPPGCFDNLLTPGYDGLLLSPARPPGPPWTNDWKRPLPSVWVLLDVESGAELERSHFDEEDTTHSAFAEQIAASVWTNSGELVTRWLWR